ncbi:MAG: YggT family protein [Clostridia bacterium]|nr:YggT family protein [Clostridia bacterium]
MHHGVIVLTIRSLLSFINPDADGAFFNFIFNLSDFLTAPARVLLDKTGWFAGLPIDMAHLFTVVLLWLILTLFSAF